MNDAEFKEFLRRLIESCELSPQAARALLERILEALQK